MQITTGKEDTWFVTSGTGRVVCAFVEEEAAKEWINNRSSNDVRYRLFHKDANVKEIDF